MERKRGNIEVGVEGGKNKGTGDDVGRKWGKRRENEEWIRKEGSERRGRPQLD